MKSIKASMLACALCLGQAFISVSSAQTHAKGLETNPTVSIRTGQLRGSLTADGVAVACPVVKEGLRRGVCDLFIENEKRQAK